MKRIAITVICFLTALILFPAKSSADNFETEYGLRQAVVLIRSGDNASFVRAMEIAEKAGAKGLLSLPPTMIFGRFPAGVGAADFRELDIRFVTESTDIDPMEVDLVTLKVARGLLDQDKILSMAKSIPMEPFVDLVFEKPLDIVERTISKSVSPREGAPAQIADRSMDQNSEFLIGNVLINLIFPESSGGVQSEDWTDDEIANAMRDVYLGLSQYENATNWVPLTFTVNCPPLHRGVPVSREPIEGDWNSDPIWISEAITYLAESYDIEIPSGIPASEMTHYFNNAMREKDLDDDGLFLYDWVFTAFVADASVNECWQGYAGGYIAYTIFLGGPYMVVPYPACWFGDGLNFAHVFIREMSRVFWALYEDASAEVSCSARSGYLNYINANSYHRNCGMGSPCIMNDAPFLSEPLRICPWTMGQVGLADEYNIFTGESVPNSIPDLYEVRPVIEAYTPKSDTTYYGDILIWVDVDQTPVPNQNTRIEEYRRIDYAPEIVSFQIAINDGSFEPVQGRFTGVSSFSAGIILQEGFDPGENLIRFAAENLVELSDTASVMIYFVGIRYYEAMAMAEPGSIEVRWKTSSEIFGAGFNVYRLDLTDRSSRALIGTVHGDSTYSDDDEYRRYRYIDDTVMPGHKYSYQIVGEINVVIDSEWQTLSYESREMNETAVVPLAGNFVSSIIPNPTDDRGSTFSIDVPRSYFDPSGTGGSRDMLRAPMAETKTKILVNIYDVAGRHVRHLYELGVFGGQIITLTWDGLDDRGKQVVTGVYFMKVKAGPKEQVQKIVIIR